MNKSFAVVILFASVLPSSHALSWPLCENGANVWVTERPAVDPQYPGANLWLFCDSGLNIVGNAVDPCINKGSLCTQAVSDGICKFLGYDKASGPASSVQARPDEVVRSLTGEYCLRKGTYSKSLPDDLATMPGEPCNRISQITCVRTIQHMYDSLEAIIMQAVMQPNPASPAPQPGDSATTAPATEDGAGSANVLAADGPSDNVEVSPNGSGGGRKLLRLL